MQRRCQLGWEFHGDGGYRRLARVEARSSGVMAVVRELWHAPQLCFASSCAHSGSGAGTKPWACRWPLQHFLQGSVGLQLGSMPGRKLIELVEDCRFGVRGPACDHSPVAVRSSPAQYRRRTATAQKRVSGCLVAGVQQPACACSTKPMPRRGTLPSSWRMRSGARRRMRGEKAHAAFARGPTLSCANW